MTIFGDVSVKWLMLLYKAPPKFHIYQTHNCGKYQKRIYTRILVHSDKNSYFCWLGLVAQYERRQQQLYPI